MAICSEGYYCPEGSSNQTKCLPEDYCPAGSSTNNTCLLGTTATNVSIINALQGPPMCGPNCAPGYYLNNFTNVCKMCVLPCIRCSNISDCITCIAGKYLHEDKKCRDVCPNNSYILEDDKTNCYNTRPEGYYFDNMSSMYKKCYETCSSCEKPGNIVNNECNSCKNGRILLGKNCLIDCPQGYEKVENSCKSCLEVKKYLFNNTCVLSCPDKYIADQRNSCVLCPYFLVNNTCYEKCPSDYLQVNDTHCFYSSN